MSQIGKSVTDTKKSGALDDVEMEEDGDQMKGTDAVKNGQEKDTKANEEVKSDSMLTDE